MIYNVFLDIETKRREFLSLTMEIRNARVSTRDTMITRIDNLLAGEDFPRKKITTRSLKEVFRLKICVPCVRPHKKAKGWMTKKNGYLFMSFLGKEREKRVPFLPL